MRKLQLGGALVLSAAMVMAGGAGAWALDEKTELDLYGAVNRVTMLREEIKECGAACQSTEFPGVDKYLERLLDDAREEMTEYEAQQYIAALEHAAVAAPLLTGLKAQQIKQEQANKVQAGTRSVNYSAVSVAYDETEEEMTMPVAAAKAEVAETKVATVATTANTKVAVTAQAARPVAKVAAQKEKGQPEATSIELEVKETVEVPTTGEVQTAGEDQEKNKLGAGILIIAGVAVMIATIGATLLIVRMKRDV